MHTWSDFAVHPLQLQTFPFLATTLELHLQLRHDMKRLWNDHGLAKNTATSQCPLQRPWQKGGAPWAALRRRSAAVRMSLKKSYSTSTQVAGETSAPMASASVFRFSQRLGPFWQRPSDKTLNGQLCPWLAFTGSSTCADLNDFWGFCTKIESSIF